MTQMETQSPVAVIRVIRGRERPLRRPVTGRPAGDGEKMTMRVLWIMLRCAVPVMCVLTTCQCRNSVPDSATEELVPFRVEVQGSRETFPITVAFFGRGYELEIEEFEVLDSRITDTAGKVLAPKLEKGRQGKHRGHAIIFIDPTGAAGRIDMAVTVRYRNVDYIVTGAFVEGDKSDFDLWRGEQVQIRRRD